MRRVGEVDETGEALHAPPRRGDGLDPVAGAGEGPGHGADRVGVTAHADGGGDGLGERVVSQRAVQSRGHGVAGGDPVAERRPGVLVVAPIHRGCHRVEAVRELRRGQVGSHTVEDSFR
jgi:hypothetical protein